MVGCQKGQTHYSLASHPRGLGREALADAGSRRSVKEVEKNKQAGPDEQLFEPVEAGEGRSSISAATITNRDESVHAHLYIKLSIQRA